MGVGVHARDVLAARVPQADVEPLRDPAARVVDHPDPRVLARELVEDRARRVLGAAVHEEELDLAVEALGPHRRDRLADVRLLVQDRREHAHVDAVPF